jgi:hypothetical protein
MDYLEQKVWSDSYSSVWKEIVSRFGQSEYDDEVKRTTHTATLKAEWVAQEYARKRKAEYDQLNQDELRFDDLENGTTVWQDTINEIKARHPK